MPILGLQVGWDERNCTSSTSTAVEGGVEGHSCAVLGGAAVLELIVCVRVGSAEPDGPSNFGKMLKFGVFTELLTVVSVYSVVSVVAKMYKIS